jgi:hypothetical protein
MTDKETAHKVYIEPLTRQFILKILNKERPDGILPTLGGQTALNLAMELAETGVLKKLGISLLGCNVETIKKAEDRKLFKELMQEIGEPVPASTSVHTVEEAMSFAETKRRLSNIRKKFKDAIEENNLEWGGMLLVMPWRSNLTTTENTRYAEGMHTLAGAYNDVFFVNIYGITLGVELDGTDPNQQNAMDSALNTSGFLQFHDGTIIDFNSYNMTGVGLVHQADAESATAFARIVGRELIKSAANESIVTNSIGFLGWNLSF